jgi:hypothetical protein
LTCWKWTAMMTLRFHQQNRVDGDGSWWQFFVAFFVIFFVHSTGILRRSGTKHEISVWKSRENLLKKNLSIVISFIVWFSYSKGFKIVESLNKAIGHLALPLRPPIILDNPHTFQQCQDGWLWQEWQASFSYLSIR